jgi:hypothetical protein
MRWRVWQTGIAPGRACRLYLSFGLLALAAGCSKPYPRSVEHGQVSGKVFFQGKPLPGGRVSFLTPNGNFASTGNIDEHGNYRINAPVGPAQISVDNRILLQAKRWQGKRRMKTGGTEIAVSGNYVPIPPKYYTPDTSQLTYEVKPEPQTHDIELSANPAPASGSPSR